MKYAAWTLLLTLVGADVAQWEQLPTPEDSTSVIARFLHGDGGSLAIMCDRSSKAFSIGLSDPRAKWQPGQTVNVVTKADDGSQSRPTIGRVLEPTALIVQEDASADILTMTQAKAWFSVSAGGLERGFPTKGLPAAIEPVLNACSDPS
jgi:hypothetical protein